jgi:hypothetical protein
MAQLMEDTLDRYSAVTDTTERLLGHWSDAKRRTRAWSCALQPLWQFVQERHTHTTATAAAFTVPAAVSAAAAAATTAHRFAAHAGLDEQYAASAITALCRWSARLCASYSAESERFLSGGDAHHDTELVDEHGCAVSPQHGIHRHVIRRRSSIEKEAEFIVESEELSGPAPAPSY